VWVCVCVCVHACFFFASMNGTQHWLINKLYRKSARNGSLGFSSEHPLHIKWEIISVQLVPCARNETCLTKLITWDVIFRSLVILKVSLTLVVSIPHWREGPISKHVKVWERTKIWSWSLAGLEIKNDCYRGPAAIYLTDTGWQQTTTIINILCVYIVRLFKIWVHQVVYRRTARRTL
jgi:hypothetical protein